MGLLPLELLVLEQSLSRSCVNPEVSEFRDLGLRTSQTNNPSVPFSRFQVPAGSPRLFRGKRTVGDDCQSLANVIQISCALDLAPMMTASVPKPCSARSRSRRS